MNRLKIQEKGTTVTTKYSKYRVWTDGTVWAFEPGGSAHYIGAFEHRGREWVALSSRGERVIHSEPTRREVIAWIKANPWEVA